jgi:DNA-binding SARP family transcriptional activator
MIDLPHKIHIPQRPFDLVTRPRLNTLLHAAIQRKLVALVAPAGYGKTSLLIDFAHTATITICWYTLDVYDADPWIFMSYLAAAVDLRFPSTMAQTIQLLEGQGQPLFRTVVATFMREISHIRTPLLICIDDWHLVEMVEAIDDVVTQIVSRCQNTTIILLSRSHPSLSNQMLLAARRQFVCIDESLLRFAADELAAVVAVEGSAPISLDQAQRLVDQSEGWITGVLLALQGTGSDISAVLQHKTAMSRPVQRFLAEQVIDKLAPDLQHFLYTTAMLEEVTAERCDSLLARRDSWVMLEHLLTQRLFISEITPGVLRYHPLFREFLQQRLRATDPNSFRALGLLIVRDYADHGNWSMAFDLCLRIGDHTTAQSILQASGEDLYLQGRLETLERAFNALSAVTLGVELLCLKARIAIDRGQFKAAQELIDQAVAQASGDQSLPRIALIQAVLDRVTGRYALARERAMQVLRSTTDVTLQGTALRTLATCQQRLDDPFAAIETLQRAYVVEQRRGAVAAVAQVQHELMVCYHTVGDLRSAASAGRQAEAYWLAISNSGRCALTRNSLALNHALSGRYREAIALLVCALRDAQDALIPQYEVAILSTLGDIYVDLARWDLAATMYDMALFKGGTAHIRAHIAIAQIKLLVAQQGYSSAADALARLAEPIVKQHPAAILLLRAQIVAGMGDYIAGRELARQAIERYDTAKSLIDHVRAWITYAWIESCAGPPNDAAVLAALERATQLADQIGEEMVVVVASRMLRAFLQRMPSLVARGGRWLDQLDRLQQLAALLDPPQLALTLPLADRESAPQLLAPTPAADQPERRRTLRVRYLGSDQVWLDETPIILGASRPREILAYLLLHPHGVARAALYRAIWGDAEALDDSNVLNRAIYRLRAMLPAGVIVTINRDTYVLDRALLVIDADVEAFEQALDNSVKASDSAGKADALWTAIDLYRGPFLPPSETPWCLARRERLERRYRQALRLVAEQSEQSGAFQKALELFHQIIAVDSTNVAAYAGVMRCYVALGEPAVAITHYRRLVHALNIELGIDLDPHSEPEGIYQAILAI